MTQRVSKVDYMVLALLLGLSMIPTFGGIVRLTSVAGDTAVTAENARFLQAPTPVVIHALSATLYCLLGAFQFAPGFRLRWPAWHRRAGKVLAVAGMAAGLTGLWMTVCYPIPLELQGPFLYWMRLAVGSAMVAAIVIGWRSILQRQVMRHEAWMIRAYALGQGAGTQAFVLLPWMLSTGESGGPTRDLLMTLAWLINIAVAEAIIRRSRKGSASRGARPRTPGTIGAPSIPKHERIATCAAGRPSALGPREDSKHAVFHRFDHAARRHTEDGQVVTDED